MPSYKLMMFVNPFEGRDDEFNDWYDNQHLHDVLTLPGVNSAQRFRLGAMDTEPPRGYLALYEVEADSLDDAVMIMKNASGTFFVADAVDVQSSYLVSAEPIGPVVASKN